jgi:hypothetical protein
MTPHAVSRNQWYTCEYYCFGAGGVLEATSRDGLSECICTDGKRYPYPVKDDEQLRKFLEQLEQQEGEI